MGYWCRICDRMLASERFSGKGRVQHICKRCQQLPKAQRDAIDCERELYGYLTQSNISAKNLQRLEELTHFPDPKLAELAAVILAIGKVKPHKRKRFGFLARQHPALLRRLHLTGYGSCGVWSPEEEAYEEEWLELGEEHDGERAWEGVDELLDFLERWEPCEPED